MKLSFMNNKAFLNLSPTRMRRPVFALTPYLLLILLFPALIGCGSEESERPNILLITIDTTRADRLGCYGYSRNTSPNLDQLAKDSLLFREAYSTSSWTLPTHASLFTGKFPSSHGARYDPEGPLRLLNAIDGPKGWGRYRARGLSPQENTLANILRSHGYRTGAVVGGPWMKKVFGLDLGFDDYDDDNILTVSGRLADDITNQAIEWIGRKEGSFFLFLNYYDPHSPFSPPEEFRSAFLDEPLTRKNLGTPSVKNALYDAEILYTDQEFGRLIDHLKDIGKYDQTLIVVTSDHGELLGENGRFGHGATLTRQEIHIPFLLKKIDQKEAGMVVSNRVQQTDVLSILLPLAGLQIPPSAQGRTLAEVLDGDADYPIIAEVYPLELESKMGDFRVLLQGDYKFTWNSLGTRMLHSLSQDPQEMVNLKKDDPERTASMEEELEKILAGLPVPLPAGPAGVVDDQTSESLKQLGYMEDAKKNE